MGAKIQDAKGGFIYCEADKLKGCDIYLDYPSVGATENSMLAAVFADGDTIIRNAAKEPEIVDLQEYLNRLGVKVAGAGTGTVHISGSLRKLGSIEHKVMPDRIIAATYMAAAGITGGDLVLKNVVLEHLSSIIYNLRECGCHFTSSGFNTVRVTGPSKPKAVDVIRTLPYPGFPTDMQAQMISLLAVARGTSIMIETVYENRYRHVEELIKMGANINLEGRLAVVKGVRELTGAGVIARDLRGAAALVLAGLAASGETTVNEVDYIDRGYEKIEEKLTQVGAYIQRL